MTDERVERRLAADVAGYSRLMGRDEERTLANLKSLRKTLVDPAIAAHRGRIVKTRKAQREHMFSAFRCWHFSDMARCPT